MSKPKSVKLRTLIMLRTLFKYSDANHPVDFRFINEQLQPYSLNCDRRALNDTIEALSEFGVKVSNKSPKYSGKVWIDDRLFSDSDIACLAFALTTNPHIPKKQAAKLLENIKAHVTVYQEPLLTNHVEFMPEEESDDVLWHTFSAIQTAISKGFKIQYTTNFLKYNKDHNDVTIDQRVPIWFSPKCFYRTGNELYMVGFKRTGLIPCAVNLKDIVSVRIPDKPVQITDEQRSVSTSEILSNADIPHNNSIVVYQGPVIFRCRGSCLQILYHRFGIPPCTIEKDQRSIITYPVENLTLTADDLHWLSQLPGLGIRIIGPEAAVKAVGAYYARIASGIVDPVFLPAK